MQRPLVLLTRPKWPANPAASTQAAPACVVCGGTDWRVLHRGLNDPRSPDAGPHDVMACQSCGAGRTWPPPSAAELASLYETTYAPGLVPDLEAIAEATAALKADHDGPAPWWRRLNATDVPALLHLSPTAGELPQDGTALDVGAHNGETLAWLAAAGFDVAGLEPNPASARAAADLGFEIRQEALETANLPAARYDLVTLSCVIEHLPDPAEALRKLYAALKPGGRLLLTTHNLASPWRRVFGRRWINWHPPFHLHHFDAKALCRLAATNGYRVRHVESRTPVYWLVYSWRGEDAAPPPPRKLIRLGWLARLIDRLFGGDCLILILERPA
ncbi:MAG: class I SAM-dependent methyltransferase [Alphaproteobacteria bacterium]